MYCDVITYILIILIHSSFPLLIWKSSYAYLTYVNLMRFVWGNKLLFFQYLYLWLGQVFIDFMSKFSVLTFRWRYARTHDQNYVNWIFF